MSLVSIYGGLVVATFVLSIKTGMILGTSWLSNRKLVAVSFLFGCLLYGLVVAFGSAQQILVSFLDRYTFVGAVVVAVFLIYLGLQGEVGQKRVQCKYALCFLPCPLCLVALAFSVIVVSSMIGTGLSRLGVCAAVLFSSLVAASSIAVRRLIQLTRCEPTAVFNSLLLFTGLLTLIFAFFIPNLVQAMTMPLGPVQIDSLRWLVAVSAGLGGISLVGYFRYQLFLKERDE